MKVDRTKNFNWGAFVKNRNDRTYTRPDWHSINRKPRKEDDGSPGFFDIDEPKYCVNPEHNPPMHLYIPPGKAFRHVCPGCGYTVVMKGNSVKW